MAKDFDSYLKSFQTAVGSGYRRVLLGKVDGGPLYLFQPTDMSKKHVLVISGQHGEEPAGPWALLRVVEDNAALLKKMSVSFLPVGNPHGFKTGERKDAAGEHTNWLIGDDGELREGGDVIKVLKKNLKLFEDCGKDALLNVHEDVTSKGFYLYVLGDVEAPVVTEMLKTGKKHFECKKDGEYTDNGTYTLKAGVVDNHSDGSLDEYLHKADTPLAITIELPAKSAPLYERVSAGADLIKVFLADAAKPEKGNGMIAGIEKAASAVAGFIGRALRPAARAASKTIRPLAASTSQLSIPADLLKNYGRVAELLPKAKAVLPGQHPVIGAATNAISRLGSAPGGYERFQHLFQNLIPDLEKYIQRAVRRSAIASEGSAL